MTLSIMKAAKQHGIFKSTLTDRVTGGNASLSSERGLLTTCSRIRGSNSDLDFPSSGLGLANAGEADTFYGD